LDSGGVGQRTVPAIGWLDMRPATSPPDFIDWVRQGLTEMGFAEGRNVLIISRYGAESGGEIYDD
jgi:hypothetical protein